MIRARWVALVVGFAFVAFATSAMASQITLQPSTQNITITEGTSGIVDLTLGACTGTTTITCTLSGSATGLSGQSGTYSLVTSGSSPLKITAGPETTSTSGVFPIGVSGATTTFTFTPTVGSPISGSVTYGNLNDGSANPHFDGTWMPGGSGPFTFDYELSPLPNGDTLECIAASNCKSTDTSDSVTISAGEFVAAEPSSVALVSLVLLGGLLIGRKKLFA